MGFNYEYGHWTDSWKVLEEFRRLQSRFDSVRTHEPRAEIKGDFMTLRRNIVSLSAIRSALSGLLEKSYDLMQSRKSGISDELSYRIAKLLGNVEQYSLLNRTAAKRTAEQISSR